MAREWNMRKGQETSVSTVSPLLRPRKRRLSPFVILGVVLIGLAVLALALWLLLPKPEVEVAEVRRDTIIKVVYGQVEVEPVNQVIVKTQLNGTIAKMPFAVGSRVRRGDILAEIRNEGLENDFKRAEEELASALKDQQIGPASLAKLEAIEREVVQNETLLQRGLISRQTYEESLNQRTALQTSVGRERLMLSERVDTARRRLDGIITMLQQSQIRSPLDGVLLESYQQLGEVTRDGSQLFRIGSAEVHLLTKINEQDFGILDAGMVAEVRLNSFPNETFKAKLNKKLPYGGDDQTYFAIFDLLKQDERILPQMRGEMNIVVDRRDDTLIVPKRALRGWGSRRLFAWFVVDGKVERREVRVGYDNREFAEILKGAQAGDLIVLGDQDLLEHGQPVRTRLVRF